MSNNSSEQTKQPSRSVVIMGLALVWFLVCVIAAQPLPTAQLSNAGYVEPGACAECHREIAESYSRTAMARTFGAVRSENEFPELKSGAFQHDASEEFFTVYAGEGSPRLKRRQVGI